MNNNKPTYCTNNTIKKCEYCYLSSYNRDCMNTPIDSATGIGQGWIDPYGKDPYDISQP